jgi:hypothetical protein
MSLAENLLNSLPTENISEDYSTNEEEHIVVDNTRKITVPAKLKTIAVTGDKDIETVMIDCVRYWDGHDLSEFAVYINYVLPNGETGTYVPYGVSRTDEYFTLEWIIGSEFTKHSGTLRFLIMARKTNAEGYLVYQWSSLLNSDMTIQLGLEPSEMSKEEELESDVITQILQSLNTKLSYSNIASSVGDDEELVMSQKATTAELRNKANALIGTVSDTAISLDDVSPVKHKVNVNTRSENLIPPFTFRSGTTENGITFTDNGDGSITLNGTPTENWFSFLISSYPDAVLTPETGFYTFSANGDTNRIDLLANAHDLIETHPYLRFDTTTATSATCDVDINLNVFRIGIHSLSSLQPFDNVTIYPKLQKGTVATPYTPYVADDTAVTVKSCGKNLFGFYGSANYGDDTAVTVDGSHVSVYMPNSAEFFSGYDTMRPYTTQYLPAGTYRVSWHNRKIPPIEEEYGVIVQTFILDSDDIPTLLVESSVKQATEYTFTLSKASKIYTSIYFVNNTVENLNAEFDLMLTPVSSDVEFEPYIEGETVETILKDGAELNSISPNMTITTDTDGVVIDTEYNKDSNIVIEKLTQAIISLGGNI